MEQIAAWLERHHVSLATGFTTIALLIAASLVILLVNRLVRHWLERVQTRLHLPYASVLTITRAISGTLWVITAMLVLDLWGVGLGGLWALLVSAAAVIGVGFLATWAMVSNFTASFFIALWRPFRLGDTVDQVFHVYTTVALTAVPQLRGPELTGCPARDGTRTALFVAAPLLRGRGRACEGW